MAKKDKISLGLAAPFFCAAVLIALPARAGELLWDKPVDKLDAAAQPLPPQAPAVKAQTAPAKKPVRKPRKLAVAPAPAAPAAAPAAPAPETAAAAQEENESVFGNQAPRKYLLNKMFSPSSLGQKGGETGAGAPGAATSGAGTPGAKGAAAPADDDDEDLQPNGMPKKYLLNRMFDSSALERPDPRNFMAQAQPPAPAQPQDPSLLDRAKGLFSFGGASDQQTTALPPVTVESQPTPAPVAPKPKKPQAVAPATPAVPAAPVVAAPAPEPSIWDKTFGGFGFGGRSDETVPNYAARPKLSVPQQRDALPPAGSGEERLVQRPAEPEQLTKPPAAFTEKVQGADGKVTGFTEQDTGKEKKFLNFF